MLNLHSIYSHGSQLDTPKTVFFPAFDFSAVSPKTAWFIYLHIKNGEDLQSGPLGFLGLKCLIHSDITIWDINITG